MSAAAGLTPRVRIMVICDEIRKSKTEVDVFHLKGVRQGITVRSLPFVPSQLWVFLLLSNPRPGVFPAYIQVVNDRTDRVILHGHLTPPPEFPIGGGVLPLETSIRCAFPEAGTYTVRLSFFQEAGTDIVKGEMPFTITLEVGEQ